MAQEPGVNINVKVSAEMSNAVDAKAALLTSMTGTPHGKSDIVRMALAAYLGLVPKVPMEATDPST
jgi:hypothetical protein